MFSNCFTFFNLNLNAYAVVGKQSKNDPAKRNARTILNNCLK